MHPASRLFLSVTLFATGSLSAQQAPFDVFPAANPPYYRVRYEASRKPGELIYPVSYNIWVPPGVKTLRGVVVHQHGCGDGAASTGLTGAHDLHWQALARKHDCALLSGSYNKLNRKQQAGERDSSGFSVETRSRALDAIPFGRSLQLDMEVWSWTDCNMGYAVGTYWYAFADTISNRGPAPLQVLNVPTLPAMTKE